MPQEYGDEPRDRCRRVVCPLARGAASLVDKGLATAGNEAAKGRVVARALAQELQKAEPALAAKTANPEPTPVVKQLSDTTPALVKETPKITVAEEAQSAVKTAIAESSVSNTAADAAAVFHPGQLAAVSGEISQASVLRSLRQAGTSESLATAKLISRGKVGFSILETDPSGRGLGGLYRFGSSEIEIYKSASFTPIQAAGYATHEATHFMQGLNPRNYNLGHEFGAFRAQGAVDAGHWTNSLSDTGLYDLLGSHPVYRGVRPDPTWPR